MDRRRHMRVLTRQRRTPAMAVLLAAWAVCIPLPLAHCVQPKSIWVFGDDYADTGNTVYMKNAIRKCGLPQYGGPQAPGNGRCTNGQTVVDQLAKQMKLPSPGPFTGPKDWQTSGVCFATAGSGALNSTNPGGSVPLAVQVAQFKQYLILNQIGNLSDAMVLISVGMNDYMQLILQGKDPVGVIDTVIPEIASAVEQIYTVSGAYRFIVFGVPPIGCIPLMRAAFNCPPNSCLSNLNSLTVMHEARLDYFLTQLSKSLPIFFSRFSVAKATVDNKIGFPAFSKPWDVACGSRGAQGQIYACGQNVTYQDGPTNELWTIGPSPITGYDYWWYDWINPTQNAYYDLWVSMWLGSSATWPLSVMGLYFK